MRVQIKIAIISILNLLKLVSRLLSLKDSIFTYVSSQNEIILSKKQFKIP